MRRCLTPSLRALAALVLAAMAACSGDTAEEAAPAPDAAAPAAEGDAPAAPESFPEVVARVNGTEIARSELIQRAEDIRGRMPPGEDASSMAFFRRVLDDLVGAELLYQASRDSDRLVDEAVIDQQLAALRARFPDENAFREALSQQGLTLESLTAEMQRDLSIESYIQSEIDVDDEISEEASRRFYDENLEQMRQPDRLRVSHVLKRAGPDAGDEARAAARTAIESVLAEARAGADFAALAREHSEDPGSAGNGGELTISRGQTVPPFEQAAFALEPGGVSGVVETGFGFHVIKLLERMEGETVSYEQARAGIEGMLRAEATRAAVAWRVEALKERGEVEIYL